MHVKVTTCDTNLPQKFCEHIHRSTQVRVWSNLTSERSNLTEFVLGIPNRPNLTIKYIISNSKFQNWNELVGNIIF